MTIKTALLAIAAAVALLGAAIIGRAVDRAQEQRAGTGRPCASARAAGYCH